MDIANIHFHLAPQYTMKEFRKFLPVSLANEIHDKLTSNEFPWFWLDDVTVSPEERSEVPDFYRSQPGMHNT